MGILIIILIVLVFPGIIISLAAMGVMAAEVMIPILVVVVGGSLFAFLANVKKFPNWMTIKYIPKLPDDEYAELEKIGYEPQIAWKFYFTCVNNHLSSTSVDNFVEMAKEVARKNSDFSFALDKDVKKIYNDVKNVHVKHHKRRWEGGIKPTFVMISKTNRNG